MTPNTESDLLYFKTLSYEEIFRLFNDSDILKVVLFENIKNDFCYYSNTEKNTLLY